MRVNILDENADQLLAADVELREAMPEDDTERRAAERELRTVGRCWVGGGAAPLRYLQIAR